MNVEFVLVGEARPFAKRLVPREQASFDLLGGASARAVPRLGDHVRLPMSNEEAPVTLICTGRTLDLTAASPRLFVELDRA